MALKNSLFFRFKDIFNWEFWPTYMFYIPLFPLYLYYSLRSGSFTYFVAANPAIKNGGDATESKFDTLKILPKSLIPESILVPKNTIFEDVVTQLEKHHLNYPLIIKPDIGYRGLLVKKLKSETDLRKYLQKYTSINFIIQDYVNYPNECGILYIRYPDKKKGKITSITLKDYLHVKGDGTSCVSDLIAENNHVKRYESVFKDLIINKLDYKPKKGEAFVLNDIGNHCKGATFINGNHLITEKLTRYFDRLSQTVKGVNFGRFDIKYNSIEELEAGKAYKIIELNGVIAEPTHIYDAKKSSFYIALKSLALHWKYVYQISKKNHKKYGVRYQKLRPVLKDLFALRPYSKNIKKLSKL
ncbi:MAG: ATP-grasp domain-containing protein [Flavobacteriaceae bacterium]|nr:ATP-grasp domain-containing protein [Flavobacteriaceae bacterium]